ncbi:hypothetical protein IAT40_008049 [Kwoniella sp. CBS 6097]
MALAPTKPQANNNIEASMRKGKNDKKPSIELPQRASLHPLERQYGNILGDGSTTYAALLTSSGAWARNPIEVLIFIDHDHLDGALVGIASDVESFDPLLECRPAGCQWLDIDLTRSKELGGFETLLDPSAQCAIQA